MKIGIIDADLIGRKKHRFPNLVSMKISAYHKNLGDVTYLLTSYDNIKEYDTVYISKVFTDTPYPKEAITQPNVIYGGTGFYFDNAPPLHFNIEHIKPDYSLYDNWIDLMIKNGSNAKEFKEYTDYSIGFLTRGCFRGCGFCVNKKYKSVQMHSALTEFLDTNRKKICLLDDNFLGCEHWKELLEELKATNKPFKFKQGLDERLLTEEKCEALFTSKYDGDYTFAFDDVKDYALIERKLKLIRKYTDSKNIKFYVLCGYKSTDANDIDETFKRIELLQRYNCLPYIMRYASDTSIPWKESELKGMYITLARWCNQPNFFRNFSFYDFCKKNAESGIPSALRYADEFKSNFSDIADKYFYRKSGDNA